MLDGNMPYHAATCSRAASCCDMLRHAAVQRHAATFSVMKPPHHLPKTTKSNE